MLFCNPTWCEDCPDIDWTANGEDIVEVTLRRDYLLIQLQNIVDSKTTESAEAAISAINDALKEDDVIYLQFLNQAGALFIIQQALNRDDTERPSPLSAAPLLYKFAKHEIGYTLVEDGKKNVIACHRSKPDQTK